MRLGSCCVKVGSDECVCEDKTDWGFVTIDSGQPVHLASGMVRDNSTGKPRFDLLRPENLPYEQQMLTRFAMLMGRGAEVRGGRNWEQANSAEDLARFKESAARHFEQWLCGETDEDHASALWFNVMGAEYVRYQLDQHHL